MNSTTKKNYIIIAIATILFISISCLSIFSIKQTQGNANVINYIGIVRGATQKLIKNELMGYPSDSEINRLDTIINELITGEGPNGLTVLKDDDYLSLMNQISDSWKIIKDEIKNVRNGGDNNHLYQLSEEYFKLADQTVSSAADYSERQVSISIKLLYGVNLLFILLILIGVVYYIYIMNIQKKAAVLNKIAYIDTLTKLANRTSCEMEIDRLNQTPPTSDIAVFMFDLNNLKVVNDIHGHQTGDLLIMNFAQVIKSDDPKRIYACRYGGDEFLVFIYNATETKVKHYLEQIAKKTEIYNLSCKNEYIKISYAVGYSLDNLNRVTIEEMIHNADLSMYDEKSKIKSACK